MRSPRFLTVVAALAAFATSLSAAEVYTFDPAHSTVGFKIRHLFSDVSGRFNDFSGSVTVDSEKPENSVVEVKIEAKSIDTGNSKRDEHLRADDFFNVEKNPEITFKSKKVEKTGDKTATVTGDLTMNGVTKEVPLAVTFLGKGKGMKGQDVTGWGVTTELNRADFGLNYNSVIEGTKVLGETVKVDIQIEAGGAK